MASNIASYSGTQENFSSRAAQCFTLLDSPYAEVCTANRSPKSSVAEDESVVEDGSMDCRDEDVTEGMSSL